MSLHLLARSVGCAVGYGVRSLGIVVVALACLSSLPARAQDEDEEGRTITAVSPDVEARREFEAGAIAFADGRFEEALASFESSYGLSGRPELLYNIAICHDRLRHDRLAVQNYDAFLAALPETPRREEVEARLPALREAIAAEDAERARLEAATAAGGTSGGGEDIAASPWLWIGIGAGVLLAGGIALGVGLATYDPGTEAPLTGTGGLTIYALSF